MAEKQVILITGTRKGIGKYLVEHYLNRRFVVIGCSRKPVDYKYEGYENFCLDVSDESKVKKMFWNIRKNYGRLDVLVNNAGVASMNHVLLTDVNTVQRIFNTNFVGVFLFCREAARLMQRNRYGRIVNFTTIAVPLKLEGEAIYTSSKAAVENFTQILAKELANLGITVNAVGPAPVRTDLIKSVSEEKLNKLMEKQTIRRFGKFKDVANVIDFFIKPESDYITGQIIYLGGA